MEFNRVALTDQRTITGTVVVIDVIRAFTTAAYAFAAGASEIVLADTVEDAFDLRAQLPNHLLMGSKQGLPVPGFHFSNSPSALVGVDLTGCALIFRTTWGTKGVIHCDNAQTILACSLCCAKATARYLVAHSPPIVTFLLTGVAASGKGEEDKACADYIEALVHQEVIDPALYVQRVTSSRSAHYFLDPKHARFPALDLTCCSQIDIFDFVMVATRCDGNFVLKATWP